MIIQSKTTGLTYHVSFHKTSRTRQVTKGSRIRKVTTVDTACVITLGKGVARQNPRDKYDHVVGKRFALARAIAMLPPEEQDDIMLAFMETFER